LEYADRGIRVNSVGPGATLTDMNSAWTNDPQARRNVESHIPMKRAATPAEIASVFAFLASDDTSYVTGQTNYACGCMPLYADFKHNWASYRHRPSPTPSPASRLSSVIRLQRLLA